MYTEFRLALDLPECQYCLSRGVSVDKSKKGRRNSSDFNDSCWYLAEELLDSQMCFIRLLCFFCYFVQEKCYKSSNWSFCSECAYPREEVGKSKLLEESIRLTNTCLYRSSYISFFFVKAYISEAGFAFLLRKNKVLKPAVLCPVDFAGDYRMISLIKLIHGYITLKMLYSNKKKKKREKVLCAPVNLTKADFSDHFVSPSW